MTAARLMGCASCAALLLAGCINPDLAGGSAATQAQSGATADAAARAAATPSSQTLVGRKVQDLRGDMTTLRTRSQQQTARHEQLRGSSQANSTDHANLVAAIRTRLQAGSPPGNPRLLEQWVQAQGELDQLAQDAAGMMLLSAELASTASLAAYVADSSRAALQLSGAVEEDHAALRALDSEASLILGALDRMQNELAAESSRLMNYIALERRNLQVLSLAIANGELYGESLANRGLANAGPAATPLAAPATPTFSPLPPRATAGQRPLVTIRFDQPNVDYEQALYQAVSQALDRFPQARFDLVAVGPSGALPAGQTPLASTDIRRNAEGVYRTLLQLGLPGDRVRLLSSAAPVATGEVQIYLR
jgi:hypothetical protein